MNLRKRIAKAERALAERREKENLVNCACREIVIAWSGNAEELEKELKGTCPVHGFLRIDRIIPVTFTGSVTDPESEKERLRQDDAHRDRLIEEYKSRELGAEGKR